MGCDPYNMIRSSSGDAARMILVHWERKIFRDTYKTYENTDGHWNDERKH